MGTDDNSVIRRNELGDAKRGGGLKTTGIVAEKRRLPVFRGWRLLFHPGLLEQRPVGRAGWPAGNRFGVATHRRC